MSNGAPAGAGRTTGWFTQLIDEVVRSQAEVRRGRLQPVVAAEPCLPPRPRRCQARQRGSPASSALRAKRQQGRGNDELRDRLDRVVRRIMNMSRL